MKIDIHDLGYDPSDLQVTISDLMVATADESDQALDSSISDVLKLMRDRMQMDVVFCSEFVDGRRVFRQVATTGRMPTIDVGGSDALEGSWCQRVVDGRLPRFIADAREDPLAASLLDQLPFPIGTHISTPIVLKSGEIYGTLCCFSFSSLENPNTEDLKTLEMTAKLATMRIDGKEAKQKAALTDTSAWQLSPR